MGRSRTFQILLALATLALVACNDKFMAQSARSKTSALAAISTTVDEAGNISANIDPSSSATQLLKFSSGELAGSAIAIPPGALSIPVSVTVGAGESLSSSQFLQDVGITNNSISAAGPSVAFTPSQPVEATNPLTLSIPFSSGSSLSLTTSNDNIVVLYRWTKVVNGESSHSMGIIPAKDVVISKDKVSFQTTKFGVFQLGKAETKIVERVNVQSAQPPAPKKDLSNPLVGTWGTCESDANRDSYSDPVFLKPQWTSVSVGSFGVSLGLRGKSEPMKVERYLRSDCSGSLSGDPAPLVKGFLGRGLMSRSPAYFSIRDASGNISESCQAAYPLKAFIDLERIQRYMGPIAPGSTTITPRLVASWASSGRNYRFDAFDNSTCGGTPLKSITANQMYDYAWVDFEWSVNIVSAASFKIVDENDASNVFGCMELSRMITPTITPGPVMGVWNLGVNKGNSANNFSIGWQRSPKPTTENYTLKFYTDDSCTTVNRNQGDINTDQTKMDLILHPDTNSIGIVDVSTSTSTSASTGGTNASPICVIAARLPSNLPPVFTRYNAGTRWIGLSWRSSDPVELLQFSGADCTGDKTLVNLDKPSGTQQQTWAGVNNLNPNTTYSFMLNAAGRTSACQNVMTTGADAPDWSSGNSQEWPAGSELLLEFNSAVTDGKEYKLRVSINGLKPVDTYSQIVPKGEFGPLVKMPASEASGQVLTVWTPEGCSFVDGNGNRFPALSLPSAPKQPLPKVICDGASSNDGGGGGGDSLGGYPAMKQASKGVNLKITNGAFTMIEDLYDSSNCAVGTRVSSRVELGALFLPGPDFLKETFPIDVTSKELSGAIFTDAGILAAKTEPNRFGCGIREWVKGQRVNLRDSSCAKNMGRTKYERLKIVGDRLYVCDIDGEDDVYGMTPDMRIPSCEINEQSFFLKRQ